jgi:hypothetical protein
VRATAGPDTPGGPVRTHDAADRPRGSGAWGGRSLGRLMAPSLCGPGGTGAVSPFRARAGLPAGSTVTACWPRGLARVRPRRDQPIAPVGAGGKHAVIADLVRAGGRDERYQAAQELVRLEHDLCRAVAPAMAQVVEKPAIGQAFQAIGRHGLSLSSLHPVSRGGDPPHAALLRAALRDELPVASRRLPPPTSEAAP